MSDKYWGKANKVAIIFGIIGGVYLLVTLFKVVFGSNVNIQADYLRYELQLPRKTLNVNHTEVIDAELSKYVDKYQLAKSISEEILKSPWGEKIKEDITFFDVSIRDGIPNSLNSYFLSKELNTIYSNIYWSLDNLDYYSEISIKNDGKIPVQNLRLEIPKSFGVYELYENNSLIQEDNFKNNINLDNLRADNNFKIKVWSNYYPKGVLKFTHDNGAIVPTAKVIIKGEGILFWIMNNRFLTIYLALVIFWAFYSIFLILKKYSSHRIDSKENT